MIRHYHFKAMVKTDIFEAAGYLLLCAGHEAGCEATVSSHA